MAGRRAQTTGRPRPEQELLLEAATGDRSAALASWESWKERNDVDSADHGAQRLLPLVYRRLTELRVDDPDLGLLKGLYRHTLYRNQVRFRWAAEAAAPLREAGLEVMVLKGAALSALHYRDSGVRPMDDVDLLVPTERAAAALVVLAERGWSPVTAVPPEAFLGVRHAEELARPDGARIDLHWNALWQPGSDAAFWEASVETNVGGEPVRALCPTDELLLACVHGSAWNPVPPVRWAADALTVLDAADDAIDWVRLTDQARARRVTAELTDTLGYLRERFAAPVPASVVEGLRSTRTRLHERIGYRAALAPPSPVRTLCVVWDRYRRLCELDTPFSRPPSFVAYVKQTWGFERSGQLSAHAARRLAAYAGGLVERGRASPDS